MRWLARRLALLAVALLGFPPAPASARELWASQDARTVIELRAFLKTLETGIRLPRGLVEGAEALEALLEEVRPVLPAEQAALLPASLRLPLYGGASANIARAWGKLVLRERVELQAGWQLAATIASHPALSGGAFLGSSGLTTSRQGAQRRLVDFDPVILHREGLLVQHNLDLLDVKVKLRYLDITVGRQVLSWGSGRLWNPTDLLSPFAPTDVDREVRHGVDALRLSIPLASTAQLELLWLPQPEWRDHGAVARGQVNLRGFDLAPSVGKYVRDLVVGLDLTGDLGPVALHAEAAWTLGLDQDAQGERDQFARAVAGLDYKPVDDLLLGLEYYYNGWGTTDPAGYLEVLRSGRVTRGEVFGAGQHYLGLTARWQATELLGLQAHAISNLTDPSLVIVPVLEYWAEQSVLLRAGGYLPFGRLPDPAGLQALTPADLLSQSQASRRAMGSLGLRSEYGSSGFGVFVQLGIYPL